jgi:hypothetical protein
MNLSRFLPGFDKPKDELTEAELDELDAQAKKDRIEHHRRQVRNGPAKFGHVTPGRRARAVRRAEKVVGRRANKAYRRDWMRARDNIARLRGQLEAVAAIKTSRGTYVVGQSVALMRNAWRGLFDGYGALVAETLGVDELDVENQEHRDAVVEAAVHHYELATKQRAA